MAVKIDAISKAHLVHPYLAKVFFQRFDEETQEAIAEGTFYQVQWKNIWLDLKNWWYQLTGPRWYWATARGIISYDNATRGSVTPAAASLTFSHTTGSSSGRAAYIGGSCITAVTWTATYNSVSATANTMGEGANSRGITFYLASPSTGANNVVITPSSNQVIIGLIMTFSGSNGTISDFTEDQGNAKTSTSITVPNFAAGDMIAEMLLIPADDPTASSAGANQTVRLAFSQQPPADPSATVTAASTNATNGTCTWSWTTARYASSSGMRINQAPSTSPTTLLYMGVG